MSKLRKLEFHRQKGFFRNNVVSESVDLELLCLQLSFLAYSPSTRLDAPFFPNTTASEDAQL